MTNKLPSQQRVLCRVVTPSGGTGVGKTANPFLAASPFAAARAGRDVTRQHLGDAFSPRLAVLRHPSRSSRLGPTGAIAIAVAVFNVSYFAAALVSGAAQ